MYNYSQQHTLVTIKLVFAIDYALFWTFSGIFLI